jgi:hypothetical protein
MAKNQLHFFANKADIQSILKVIEAPGDLRFVQTGLFDTPELDKREKLSDDPELGLSSEGDQANQPGYLVAGVHAPISIQEVPQRKGGDKVRRRSGGDSVIG